MLVIQVSLCYILKHLEDRKACYVHIYYTWCDIIPILKLHRHSLKIRMTSYSCNKYEHTTLSYLLSVHYMLSLLHDLFSFLANHIQEVSRHHKEL